MLAKSRRQHKLSSTSQQNVEDDSIAIHCARHHAEKPYITMSKTANIPQQTSPYYTREKFVLIALLALFKWRFQNSIAALYVAFNYFFAVFKVLIVCCYHDSIVNKDEYII